MKPLVVVNGWGMTAAAWNALRAALHPARELVCMDVETLVAEGAATLRELAHAVARRAPHGCDVVGWSLGAQLALQWAHDVPAQVSRLVTIAGTPRFVADGDWVHAMPSGDFEAFAAGIACAPDATLARFALLQAKGDEHAGKVTRALRGALGAPVTEGLGVLRRADLRPLLARIAQPVLVIQGEDDALVPVAAAQALAAGLPHARLHVMPATGHAPHVSRTAETARLIEDFLHDR